MHAGYARYMLVISEVTGRLSITVFGPFDRVFLKVGAPKRVQTWGNG